MNRPDSPARRQAVKILAALGAAALGGAPLNTAAQPPVLLKRPIPRSGEWIPAVGLGTSRTFDVGSSAAERASPKEVLRQFVELGGSLVDSSPMYGEAEAVTGDLAAELKVQGRLFMATKVWTSGRDAGIRQMEQSFIRMRVPRMDLMQIHNLLDLETHARTLQQWKQAGKIRYTGVTHYHEGAYRDLERIIARREFDFVQFNYSIVEREAEARLLPLALDTGTAVIVNRPFARANVFQRVRGKTVPDWAAEFDCRTWGQFFLKYILAHPAVTCVIPATGKPQHLADNMGAGLGRLPDAAARKRMVQLIESL